MGIKEKLKRFDGVRKEDRLSRFRKGRMDGKRKVFLTDDYEKRSRDSF